MTDIAGQKMGGDLGTGADDDVHWSRIIVGNDHMTNATANHNYTVPTTIDLLTWTHRVHVQVWVNSVKLWRTILADSSSNFKSRHIAFRSLTTILTVLSQAKNIFSCTIS